MPSHLAHGAVCLQEVGLKVGIKQVARDALNGVVNRQHVDALAILDVSALHRSAPKACGCGCGHMLLHARPMVNHKKWPDTALTVQVNS